MSDILTSVQALMASGRVPLVVYRAHYKGDTEVGFRLWVHRVNREVLSRWGVKLRIVGDACVALGVERQLRYAKNHARKAIRQKQYEMETYDGVLHRNDAEEEARALAAARRDRAASGLTDLRNSQRRREHIARLLDGK